MAQRRRVYEAHPDLGRLSSDNRHHLERVLRLQPGDEFFVVDGKGGEYRACLRPDGAYSAEPRQVPRREPRLRVELALPLLKGDAFDWVMEKAGELGVSAIVPLVTSRSVAREPTGNRMERWQKLLAAAMLQSGGCVLCRLAPVFTLAQFCRQHAASAADRPAFFFHEDAPRPDRWTRDLNGSTAATLVTGPEGGFSPEEAGMLDQAGFRPVGLGVRILKAETAPIVGAALLLHAAGDLG